MIGVIVVRGRYIGHCCRYGAHRIEMVGDETFLGNENKKTEFFEDGNLSDSTDGDGSKPAAGIVTLRNIDSVICTDGDHRISIWLMKVGGAIYTRSTDGIGSFLTCEAVLGFPNSTIEWCSFDDDALRYSGHGVVGESGICEDTESERFGVLLV